ncbi:MAG: tRNA (N6-isopentenyl adenosine(37)-C2)-methylthiotransferase MiaB [bacterium]
MTKGDIPSIEKNEKVYIETYGCQMNFSDSEIVTSILNNSGYHCTNIPEEADILFVNTCSIRENAEQRVRHRLHFFRSLKKKKPGLVVGLLGCMAERTKASLMEDESLLDLIAGPDAYRQLPELLKKVGSGQTAINTILSLDETYADIHPVRLDSNGVSGFISIMRGCENFCSYCVVPSTRGQERSREFRSIINETKELYSLGYREVTLLGQNVNSYRWIEKGEALSFARLLSEVARVSDSIRVRYATSHPKDLSEELLRTMADHRNICRSVHLPVQSGSNKILEGMNRKYSREQYLENIDAIRQALPDCSVTTDIITGFCSETEEDHLDTLSVMKLARFDFSYMFKYSERPGTIAAQAMKDDVSEAVKERRLREIIALQQELSLKSNKNDIGKVFEVLIEGESKRSNNHFFGRNSQNKVIVFNKNGLKTGDYVNVKISRCTSATLMGEIS